MCNDEDRPKVDEYVEHLCVDGKPHEFEGWVVIPNGGSTKCTKCGALAIDIDTRF